KFLDECRSMKSRVWLAGLRTALLTWHFSQLNGGSIWLWHTRQSAICGKLAFVTAWLCSRPRWQAAHAFCVLRCRRMSPRSPRYAPLSIAAATTGAMLPIARCCLWLNLTLRLPLEVVPAAVVAWQSAHFAPGL